MSDFAAPTPPSPPTLPTRRTLLGAVATALAVPTAAWVAPAWAAPAAGPVTSLVSGPVTSPVTGTVSGPSLRQPTPLILAQEAPDDIDPAGWLVSEKFDGVRAWWDGRVLRFRSGLVVAAPDSFLKALPPVPLDGELWLGRGRFDELSGIVRRGRPDEAAWRDVRYMAFEMPGAGGRFDERARALRQLLKSGGDPAARSGVPSVVNAVADSAPIAARTQAAGQPRVMAVEQFTFADRATLRAALDRLVAEGGEGLMLHRADAPEVHGRSRLLLKLKPLHDDEAVVIGHQPGSGRLSGRLGALRVRDDAGRVFEVGTGLSDAQRDKPPAIGSRITFTHRGRTPSGLPRFAAFLRERAI